jgi:hypothetical protein
MSTEANAKLPQLCSFQIHTRAKKQYGAAHLSCKILDERVSWPLPEFNDRTSPEFEKSIGDEVGEATKR